MSAPLGSLGPPRLLREAGIVERAARPRYAGWGAREAPADMLQLADMLADRLRAAGWVLRSGHAPGMDTAFEDAAGDDAEVFLPWPTYGADGIQARAILDKPTREAFAIAEAHHPAWPRCTAQARRLHARNAHIVLGAALDSPATFGVCWFRGGGGSAQTARIAEGAGVPVFNLADAGVLRRVEAFVG